MTREAFIKKWLGNRDYNYCEEHKDIMRDDLDSVLEFHKGQANSVDLADVGGSLPNADAITDAAIEYAELPENCTLNDPRVCEAEHFVAGATWYYKQIKKQ